MIDLWFADLLQAERRAAAERDRRVRASRRAARLERRGFSSTARPKSLVNRSEAIALGLSLSLRRWAPGGR